MKHVLVFGAAVALGASSFAPVDALPTRHPDHATTRAPQALGAGPTQIAGNTRRYNGPLRALARLGARYVGPVSESLMSVDVTTTLRNEAGLRAYAQAASTPGSVYYRQFLTPQQLADAFGTPAAQYETTAAYFRSFGLQVKTWTPRSMMAVTGTSRRLEAALHTTFGRFAITNRARRSVTFTAPTTAVELPAALAVSNFGRLVAFPNIHVTSLPGGPPVPAFGGFSNARVNGLTPAQLARAFDLTGAYRAGFTGKGINLGVIGTGPISLEDVPNYKKLYGVGGTSTVTIVPTTVNGDSTPPPVTGTCTGGTSTSPTATCNPEDLEAQLDTEQTASLAPDANVLFYLAYNGTGCTAVPNPAGSGCVGPSSASQGLFLSDDELMQAVNDNRADILSLSYGGCEDLDISLMALNLTPGGDATGVDPTLFAQLAAEGIAVFVSSGDSGSAGCQRLVTMNEEPNASYPSSDPNVVSVGGTTTPVGQDGNLTGPITAWGQQTKSGGAEGAGQSKAFQLPPYQKTNPGVTAAGCTMRCQPDVVLDADPFTGAAVLYNSGKNIGPAMESPIGGTSQAAPDMAATWAVVLSACKVTPSCVGNYGKNVVDPAPSPTASPAGAASPAYRLGNPNFLWYKLADPANKAQFNATFYDIVYGNDAVPSAAAQTAAGMSGQDPYAAGIDAGSVSAGPGFDQATGLGAPFARALIKFVVGV